MAKKQTKKDARTSNIPVKKGNKKDQQPKEKGILIYKVGMTVADVAQGMDKTISSSYRGQITLVGFQPLGWYIKLGT